MKEHSSFTRKLYICLFMPGMFHLTWRFIFLLSSSKWHNFFFMLKKNSIAYILHIFFKIFIFDKHLGRLCSLETVNCTAIAMKVIGIPETLRSGTLQSIHLYTFSNSKSGSCGTSSFTLNVWVGGINLHCEYLCFDIWSTIIDLYEP